MFCSKKAHLKILSTLLCHSWQLGPDIAKRLRDWECCFWCVSVPMLHGAAVNPPGRSLDFLFMLLNFLYGRGVQMLGKLLRLQHDPLSFFPTWLWRDADSVQFRPWNSWHVDLKQTNETNDTHHQDTQFLCSMVWIGALCSFNDFPDLEPFAGTDFVLELGRSMWRAYMPEIYHKLPTMAMV